MTKNSGSKDIQKWKVLTKDQTWLTSGGGGNAGPYKRRVESVTN